MAPIGVMQTDFDEKFGAPRQPGVVEEAKGYLHLPRNEENREALHGLEGFSHLWVIFIFSEVCSKKWSPRVRPPRLGGDTSMGLFATRTPFRPNPIGLSALRYLGKDEDSEHFILNFTGVDLVNGTPIIDIKPYLPYADCLPQATCPKDYSQDWPKLKVIFDDATILSFNQLETQKGEELRSLITSCLEQDPRPAVQRDTQREHGISLRGFNIRFRVDGGVCRVLNIDALR